jgi:prophage regulatory protein
MKEIVLFPMPLDEFMQFIKDCVNEGLNNPHKQSTLPQDSQEYLTTVEAARFLKVSLVSIHTWKREQGLPFYRIGRSLRFKKSDLVAFTEKKNKKRV